MWCICEPAGMIATVAPFVAGLDLFFCGAHFIGANVTPLVGRRPRACR
jgi:hypothetical protein